MLKPAIERLGRKLANRIVLPSVMKDTGSVTELNLDNEQIFMDSRSLFLGGTTKFTLNRLRNNGTISDSDYKKIHDAAHHYFKSSLKYILEKLTVIYYVMLFG
jgi:hypothetical protein